MKIILEEYLQENFDRFLGNSLSRIIFQLRQTLSRKRLMLMVSCKYDLHLFSTTTHPSITDDRQFMLKLSRITPVDVATRIRRSMARP
ncbi:hypothetical protein CEXT_98621 [Caerostris extrusa]|uniref:Uncharacterized protein n=1 Tax=Caerostris extrusa TaxID=172846 RepID=A0AAV4XJX0_CAEEX|nr:hypothetical protein CEXT_98621 [Caerostris extrusa]